MSLPVQSAPIYNMNIPSTGKKVNFRPFLVKEEKALLLAQQSEDMDVMIATLKNIISSCVTDKIDIDSLAVFDIEYMFTQIRAKSIGEFSTLIFTCTQCDQENNKVKMEIDLTKIPVVKNPNHTNKIPLFDNVGVLMRYPSLNSVKKSYLHDEDIDSVMEVVIDCIEAIYTDEEMFYTKDQMRAEIEEFVMNLTKQQFDKIEDFFVTVPQFKQDIDFDCPACGAHNHTVLEGTNSFF
jgi:Zn finger protein HypA/HybF involved in hydrogenase expression